MFNKEKNAKSFKFKTIASQRLEASVAFLKSKGYDFNLTTLLEKKIEELPTNDQELEAMKEAAQQPLNPLFKIYAQLKLAQPLSRSDLELLAVEGREAVKNRQDELVFQPLLLAMHDVFSTAWKTAGNKSSPQRDGFDSYYKGNLVRQRQGLEESIIESRHVFVDPSFRGSPEFPCRNLAYAARREPFLDLRKITSEARFALETILKAAIRNQYTKTQETFQAQVDDEPDCATYFEKHSKTETLSAGIFRLDVLWDHSTAGGELTLNLGKHQPIIRCGNFIVLLDLMLLLQNIASGGPGGSRGPFLIETNSYWSGPTGATFQYKCSGSHIRFSLSDEDLNSLKTISDSFWETPGVFQRLDHLTWMYGLA